MGTSRRCCIMRKVICNKLLPEEGLTLFWTLIHLTLVEKSVLKISLAFCFPELSPVFVKLFLFHVN